MNRREAFFLGVAMTAAVLLYLAPVEEDAQAAAQTSRELSEIHWIKHPEEDGWRFTGRERIPGQDGITVQYFQDVATGTCFARFDLGYKRLAVTWVPCEATDR